MRSCSAGLCRFPNQASLLFAMPHQDSIATQLSPSQLTHAIRDLIAVLKNNSESSRPGHEVVTKCDLDRMEIRIMSVISDFAAKQKAFNERQGKAIDAAVESVNGLVADVKTLNDKITELQNSTGGVTPEDQALINELETQGESVATRLEGVAEALKALDTQTPPVVPPVQ